MIANKLDAITYACVFHIIKEEAGSSPTYLLADADGATRAAFKQVFGSEAGNSPQMSMCWYHVSKNVKRRIGKSIWHQKDTM